MISVFDVLGPNMIGPSSSHTAGANVIAYLAHKMISGKIERVIFTLYGSFAKTYRGHGTDRALLGGVLGMQTDDVRIRDSYQIADETGLDYQFRIDEEMSDIHPNTVDIDLYSDTGSHMLVRGESLGGGKVRIGQINGVDVDFSGLYSALILIHQDQPGVVACVTKVLSEMKINIAFMRVFRESKGKTAYTIIESDECIPEEAASELRNKGIFHDVMLIQR